MRKLLSLMLLSTLLFSFSCSEETEVDFPLIGEPKVTLSQDVIKVDMYFETIQLDNPFSIPIPEFSNSYVEFYPDADPTKGTHMTVNLWMGDLFDTNLQQLPPQKLPDGRNLPGISKGFLPSVAFQVPQMGDVTFYIGKDFFGFFAPYDNLQNTDSIITARLYNNGTRLGNISLVGSVLEENRGVLVLMNTDLRIKRRLKKIYDQYN